MQQTGVENRAVPGHRSGRHDRLVAQPLHWARRVDGPRLLHCSSDVSVGHRVGPSGPNLDVISVLAVATSDDGVTDWQLDRARWLEPETDSFAALFPVRFDGRWALIHRPAPAMHGLGAHVWVSFSPDLRHFGDAQVLLPARRGGWWDANKVGLGPPPLLTERGWLICYHGVRVTASSSLYRLGLALLDRDDPTRVRARGNEWIFGPQETYERSGDVPDVVFPCGWVLRDDGDTIDMYYGAADSVVCMARASLRDLLDHLDTHPCRPSRLDPAR